MSTAPTGAYRDILLRAQTELSPEEQRRLAEALAEAQAEQPQRKLRITDLRGLGKEVWEGIDPDEYVAQERDSWDG